MNNNSIIFSHITLLLGILIYISYPKQFSINSSLLYYLSIIHNGILIIFSAWTFISLVQILYNNGIVFESNYYFQNPKMDNIIYFFYISKYYEFFDTFLLYLNGKTPIFLQKYHHIGAVICWHLCYYYKVDAIWIATILNSFVHTIMYSYYLGCLLKINYVRFIKKYITTLQLCQLIFQPLSLYLYTNEKYYNILLFFTMYTIGLVILFSIFYYNNYIINNKSNQ
jgi:hypothetical protein